MLYIYFMQIRFLFLILLAMSCSEEQKEESEHVWDSVTVTASAYNSTVRQTSGNPNITAFGDSLKPGMKYIAVSQDLLRKGLKHNTPVVIEGFDGVYLVKDKMHFKWRNHIDIYMGEDIEAARKWGRRKVCIEFRLPKEE
ncbi:3D domain-containing protein [Gelidibacter gilvus]|nr:3D domain-containing protein [Gelidibacter gilvus]